MSARDRISQIVERWFLIEPLFFSVWATHHLTIEPRIRTIRVGRGQIEYNPKFIDNLDRHQLDRVLRFEVMRILLKHPYSRRKEHPQKAYLASNVTLQEYLQTDLPIPRAYDLFDTHEFDQQYYEFYYYKLLEAPDRPTKSPADGEESLPQAGGGSGEGQGEQSQTEPQSQSPPETTDSPDQEPRESEPETADSESSEGSGGESTPLEDYINAQVSGRENTEAWDDDDLATERINQQIRTAQEMASWGTISDKLRERILATLHPKLDYRAVLRQFRASILSVKRVLTRMKPSRRYGFQYMGSRRDFITKLLFAVDVSGSISSQDLRRGFSIINQFFKYGMQTIDVIQFDTDIRGKKFSLKRARHEIEAIGRGGTDFRPVMNYIDQHRQYDGLIIFTDGYAPVPRKPKNHRTPILWLFNNETSYKHMHHSLRHIGRAVFLKED